MTNNKAMFSEHQSLYFAHWLTLKGRSDKQISRAMASARVDMNPHQIEAAIFASSSFALAGTLESMILRLEKKQLSDEEILADLEEADDWQRILVLTPRVKR